MYGSMNIMAFSFFLLLLIQVTAGDHLTHSNPFSPPSCCYKAIKCRVYAYYMLVLFRHINQLVFLQSAGRVLVPGWDRLVHVLQDLGRKGTKFVGRVEIIRFLEE